MDTAQGEPDVVDQTGIIESQQGQPTPAIDYNKFADEILKRVEDLSLELADVAGDVEAIARHFEQQTDMVDQMRGKAQELIDAFNRIDTAGGDTSRAAQETIGMAEEVNQGVGQINDAVDGIGQSIGTMESQIQEIVGASSSSRDQCNGFIQEMERLVSSFKQTGENLQTAEKRVSSLLERGEGMIGQINQAGLETSDSKFIREIQSRANEIARRFEAALDAGEITEDALFSETYEPIPGTDPEQCMTPFVTLTDRLLPDLQEPMLEFDAKVVFCAAVDRNGFLPTHNNKFSKPPTDDPVWNNGNCRNRRMFNDRTGLRAGQNTRPFFLQTYRRDMGGGNYVLMKDLSAPITVRGRHWGGLRLGYKI